MGSKISSHWGSLEGGGLGGVCPGPEGVFATDRSQAAAACGSAKRAKVQPGCGLPPDLRTFRIRRPSAGDVGAGIVGVLVPLLITMEYGASRARSHAESFVSKPTRSARRLEQRLLGVSAGAPRGKSPRRAASGGWTGAAARRGASARPRPGASQYVLAQQLADLARWARRVGHHPREVIEPPYLPPLCRGAPQRPSARRSSPGFGAGAGTQPVPHRAPLPVAPFRGSVRRRVGQRRTLSAGSAMRSP